MPDHIPSFIPLAALGVAFLTPVGTALWNAFFVSKKNEDARIRSRLKAKASYAALKLPDAIAVEFFSKNAGNIPSYLTIINVKCVGTKSVDDVKIKLKKACRFTIKIDDHPSEYHENSAVIIIGSVDPGHSHIVKIWTYSSFNPEFIDFIEKRIILSIKDGVGYIVNGVYEKLSPVDIAISEDPSFLSLLNKYANKYYWYWLVFMLGVLAVRLYDVG